VVEWFRTDLRRGFLAAIAPALICACVGWFFVVLGSRMVTSRLPAAGLGRGPTLPVAAMVDGDGRPLDALELQPVEGGLLGLGALLAIASPFLLAHRLLRRWRTDECELLLRTDGLVLRSGEEETTVPWDEVEEVVHRPKPEGKGGDVLLVRHDGTEVLLDAPFDGVEPPDLVRRIRSVRNRALFGFLEAEPWPERAPSRGP
jgi:hypothetical protein